MIEVRPDAGGCLPENPSRRQRRVVLDKEKKMKVPLLTCETCRQQFRPSRRVYNQARAKGRDPYCSRKCAGIARRIGREMKNTRRQQRCRELKELRVDHLRDMVAVMIDLLIAIPDGVAEAEVMVARLALDKSETALGRRYVRDLEKKDSA